MKEQIYEEAGMTGAVGFGDSPAVVVVDLQTAFTDPACPLGADLDDTVEATAELLTVAREADVPVVFTRCVYRKDRRDGAVFAEKIPSTEELTSDSEWVELDPRLAPPDDAVVIEKQQPSAFLRLGWTRCYLRRHRYRRNYGRNHVGVCPSDGRRRLFAWVSTDSPLQCVGDRAQEPHEANLFDMGSIYADLLDRQDVEEPPRGGADGDQHQ